MAALLAFMALHSMYEFSEACPRKQLNVR